MNHSNSRLAHGTNGSPQLMLENGDMTTKVKENELKIEKKSLIFMVGKKGKYYYQQNTRIGLVLVKDNPFLKEQKILNYTMQ